MSVANNIKADITSHVEGLPELAAKDAGYNATRLISGEVLTTAGLCKCLQTDPTTAPAVYPRPNHPPMAVNMRVKHYTTVWQTSVSVIDTTSNAIVANNTDFAVALPMGFGGRCAVVGDCVLQWLWYSVGAKQAHESCVDIVVKPISEMFRL
ncbi:hypothetical protein BJ878DRAFT_477601 [Calycina marina]|uniref:Uncharacterized protein n=1 Tax=Calycina marina TaxID=1763456 RepID=A0A9P7Z883_9HELO|nr:hypothetical protein BJ878DRAFT_477601 [Calycina marina]